MGGTDVQESQSTSGEDEEASEVHKPAGTEHAPAPVAPAITPGVRVVQDVVGLGAVGVVGLQW